MASRQLMTLTGALVCALWLLFAISPPGTAQQTAPPHPQSVSVVAGDGLTLRGDFYHVAHDRPTVLLLHQLYTTRRSWSDLIPALLEAHYNVLAVDLRGYGATGGRINWALAVEDVQIWLDWLRAEADIHPDKIHIMGSSMGSALAVVGCAHDGACRSAVALSAGRDYFGVNILDALAQGMAGRPTLIFYAERDRYPALGMPDILSHAPEGTLTIHAFKGNAHGMDLLRRESEAILPILLAWFGA